MGQIMEAPRRTNKMTMHKFYNFLLPRKDLSWERFLYQSLLRQSSMTPCALWSRSRKTPRDRNLSCWFFRSEGTRMMKWMTTMTMHRRNFPRKKIKSSERYGCQVATGSDLWWPFMHYDLDSLRGITDADIQLDLWTMNSYPAGCLIICQKLSLPIKWNSFNNVFIRWKLRAITLWEMWK